MATRRQAPQTQASRLSDQEDDMRAIDCPCGHHLEATDDAELLRLCREHIADRHPRHAAHRRADPRARRRRRLRGDGGRMTTVAQRPDHHLRRAFR